MNSVQTLLQDLRPFLELEWAGNSLARAIAAAAVFLVLLVAFRAGLPFVLGRVKTLAERSRISADDAIVALLSQIPRWVLSLLALLLGLSLLRLPDPGDQVVKAGIFAVCTYLGIAVVRLVIELSLVSRVPSLRAGDRNELPAVLRVTLVIGLWCIGILLILSNLGINVISLVTGLGIGGIAVALALQNILGDMFSSFALYMDKPFREGEFIVTGQHMGVVKQIGLKTTRIQALEGEEIVIPNQELTAARIQNYKRMSERRVVFGFRVTYDTPLEKLRTIPEIVRSIVERQEEARFDRAHFVHFGESSLDFEVVYYVQKPEYALHMDIRQAVNLELVERFAAEGIAFAYPTRTVHLEKAE